ncbi:hypothetical protein SKAU_G00388480 [Synaphobranchus kaupii]|uniref:Uncharacterized protein n=1 Tax=Synaphobranchus kaupii TaxID=118154 RepID=A0A9Q1IDE0_SYNKA|nr:hypothetical protein SKAU_G00388480 [Synaphobranchus kaupii]
MHSPGSAEESRAVPTAALSAGSPSGGLEQPGREGPHVTACIGLGPRAPAPADTEPNAMATVSIDTRRPPVPFRIPSALSRETQLAHWTGVLSRAKTPICAPPPQK